MPLCAMAAFHQVEHSAAAPSCALEHAMQFPIVWKAGTSLWRIRRERLCPHAAWSVLVALVLYIAASGPHHVHHLGEHDARPVCPVLFLIEHMPGEESLCYCPPAFMPIRASALLPCSGITLTRPLDAFRARAPPLQHL
jgi:hypothetical protein